MNKSYRLFIFLLLISCKAMIESTSNDSSKENNCVAKLPKKENFWIFIMAGLENPL